MSLLPLCLKRKLDPKTREVLLELRQILELNHENLNPFVGVSLEPDPAIMVMAYASRGNLHEVILDSNFSLTWDIKFSLIRDITNGMRYLHSNYGWHGNLSSLTCLIDHRWICKIADYGFQKFKQFGSSTTDDPLEWIAPEFTGTETDFGSKKGDVYSFGAICQDVVTEDIPVENGPDGKIIFQMFVQKTEIYNM